VRANGKEGGGRGAQIVSTNWGPWYSFFGFAPWEDAFELATCELRSFVTVRMLLRASGKGAFLGQLPFATVFSPLMMGVW